MENPRLFLGTLDMGRSAFGRVATSCWFASRPAAKWLSGVRVRMSHGSCLAPANLGG